MESILTTWGLYTAAMAAVASVLSGFEIKGGFKDTLAIAALFGLLNWALSSVAAVVFAVLTLGLSLWLSFITHSIITALLLLLTDALSDRLKIRSFWTALVAGFLMSLLVTGARKFLLPIFGLG